MLAAKPLKFITLSPYFQLTITREDPPFLPMNNDRAEVDELILEILDYKNDYADMLPKNF